MNKISLKIILILAIIGIALSAYSLTHHFEITSGDFCSIGDSFDCGKVNQGEYSKILGIPVAVLGMLFYCLILALTLMKIFKIKVTDIYWDIMFYVSIVGLLFTLYLTFIEAFIIKSFCIICLASFAVVLGIFIMSFKIVLRSEN